MHLAHHYVAPAFIILASGDNPKSLGRVINALMGAYEIMENGGEVKIIIDGAGTQAAAALSAPDHKYHDLFKLLHSNVSGICSYRANAFGVAPQIEQANLGCASVFGGADRNFAYSRIAHKMGTFGRIASHVDSKFWNLLRSDWATVGVQMIYVIAYFLAFYFFEYNQYSLDRISRSRKRK
jgi:hypothetical protein